jgi:FkbM family methyltransferase
MLSLDMDNVYTGPKVQTDTIPPLTFREGTNDQEVWKEQPRAYKGLEYTGSIVLDIGLHAGFFARYALSQGAKHVTGFEPHPDNFRTARNNLTGMPCTLYNAAVTPWYMAAWGTTKLYSNNGSNAGSHSLFVHGGRTAMDVHAISFQEALSKQAFTVLKIDIEGGEYALDMSLLPDNIKMVAMELHLNKREWRWRDAPNILETLAGLGFQAIKQPHIGEKNWHTTGVWRRE